MGDAHRPCRGEAPSRALGTTGIGTPRRNALKRAGPASKYGGIQPSMGSSLCAPVPSAVAGPQILVSVADLRESGHPSAVLITLALGSCLGVTCYDPGAKVGALLHAMLPDSTRYRDLAANASRCLDTGVPAMLERVVRLGANRGALEFKVFGGAQILQANEFFSIGRQNIDAMKALVERHRLNVRVWDVGGALNRSIKFHLSTGRVHLRMPNRMEVSV